MSTNLIILAFFMLGVLYRVETARVNQLSDHYPTVTCMVQDKFNEDELLICAQYSIKKMNVENLSFTDVAGINNIQGYAEGIGDQARFTAVEHILQINSSTVITTDHGNHCLRQVSGRTTSTYAGNCTEPGTADGSLLEARFHGPIGFVQVGTTVFLTEWQNKRIRLIDLVGKTISKFIGITNPTALVYIDCYQPCDTLYFTLLHGVGSIKRSNKDFKLLLGSLSLGIRNHGPFDETTMNVPEDILVHNERFIFVADRDNNRVLLLDLQLEMSHVVAEVLQPWSLHIRGDKILIGTRRTGIYTADIRALLRNITATTTPPTTVPFTSRASDTTPRTVPSTRAPDPTETTPTPTPDTTLTTPTATTVSPTVRETRVPGTIRPITIKTTGPPPSEIGTNESDPSGRTSGLETNVLIAIIASCVVVVLIVAVAVTICFIKSRNRIPTLNRSNPIYNRAFTAQIGLQPTPGVGIDYRDSQKGVYEEIDYNSMDTSFRHPSEQPPEYDPYLN